METAFDGWDWHDPDALDAKFESFTANIATFDTLEVVAQAVPRGRADLRAAGITGIEFAAFKTQHPQGLATDLVSVRARKQDTADAGSGDDLPPQSAAAEAPLITARGPVDAGSEVVPEQSADSNALFVTHRGPMYRVDGESLFTELDIAEPLPFDDASLDWVYAEHLIEHVPLPVAVAWLKEVRRTLAPGGLLRLTTPDLAVYVEGYGGGGFFAKHRRRLAMVRVGPPMPTRRAFMVNQIFYHFGHRWIYDEEELRFVLGEAGFDAEKITRCAFRTGARPDVADLDTSMRSDESIYVEAVV